MTATQMKPWSQLDDEPVTSVEESHYSCAESPSYDDSGNWKDSISSIIERTGGWPMTVGAASALWMIGVIAFSGSQGGGWKLALIPAVLVQIGVIVHKIRGRALGADNDTDEGHVEGTEIHTNSIDGQSKALDFHTKNIEKRVEELLEERKQFHLETSLISAQKKQIQNILNSISDPILVTSRFDQVVFANTALTELLNLEGKEVHRQPISGLVDEKLVRLIRQAREADIRASKRKAEFETSGRAYALSMSPYEDATESTGEDSRTHGVITIIRDITREREASKAKSEFVAHVSHELRTPLSSIRAYVEMLVDGEAADEKTREEYYSIIQTSAQRLDRLIDNMLNISRIEAGTVRINKARVAISMIVKEVTDSLRPQAEQKNIALIAELAPVVDQVMADRDLMYQAVLNLVSNAIKYTPDGGQVTVRMFSQDESNTIRIEVVDTGVGIPEQDLPRVFEKFFRVEANKEMAKGTGLGLNLVKNIVEVVHEGKLSLSSAVGRGSTFAITLAKIQAGNE